MSKKTVAVIVDSGNDYLIGVKKNQPTLYHQIKNILSDRNNYSSYYTTLEINRGRTELRSITVSNVIDGINQQWKGLQQIIRIHRTVRNKTKISEETAYFISSKNENAFLYEEGIRSHWAIENTLHWVKDVTLKEDASLIRMGNAPQNISTIKNIGINIFRENNYNNIAQAMRLVANDINTLFKIIT